MAVCAGARHGHGLFRVRELPRQRLHGRKVQQAHVRHIHDRRAAQHRAQLPAHPVEARRAGRGHRHVRELFCRVRHPGGGCAQVQPVPVLCRRRHGKLHPADGADALHRPAASGLEDRTGSVHLTAAPAQPQAASGRRGKDRPLPPLTQRFGGFVI